jgi:hypothetical protein
MSIGPVLEISDDLARSLRSALDREHIRVEDSGDCFIFRTRLAALKGRLFQRDGRRFLWLTVPKAHAFNPLFWPLDFPLSNRVERTLKREGARSVEWISPE